MWRDIKIRYKQTAVGVAWAILQPLLTMLVFSLFFGRLAHIPSDGLPYPIFYYSCIASLDVFRRGPAECYKHDRRKSAAHHESLFPAAGTAALFGSLRIG